MFFQNPSIFDTKDTSNFKIWSNSLPNFSQNSQIKFHLLGKKRTSSNPMLKNRHYFIRESFLYYQKKESTDRISNAVKLNWFRVHFSELSNLQTGRLTRIALIRNGKFTCVYQNCDAEVKKWRNALRMYCVLTDFEERYVEVGRKDVMGNQVKKINFIFYIDCFLNPIFNKLKKSRFYNKLFYF